mgnify:CR=1 FL=1
MKIVVCVKQVPSSHNVRIDPETKRLKREEVEAEINPFDTYALEQGVLIKESLGGEVIALTMGPNRAEQSLREAIACGADKAIHLHDRAFAGSDTWATSYTLSKAIEKIGDVDLVICGKQAIDGDTAQVGPGIAGHLGLPQATYVSEVKETDEKSITVKRMHEEGYDIAELPFPALITVVKDINSPRIPSLRGRMAAKKAEITQWTAEDLGADGGKLGTHGSPTKVVKTEPAPGREKETLVIEGEPEKQARDLVHQLRARSLA